MLKQSKDQTIVTSLVYLAVGVKLAADAHPLKAVELNERLDLVNKMLTTCMDSESMDEEENVSLVFQDFLMLAREQESPSNDKVCKARTFQEGPLSLCVKHELLPILGTRPVSCWYC